MQQEPDVGGLVRGLRQRFNSGLTRTLAWRQERLDALDELLVRHEEALVDALAADLGKPRHESLLSEILFTRREVRHARRHVRAWMRSHWCPTPLLLKPSRAWWRWEPRGVALILGPWNFPVQLMLGPLVGCLAAGNCAILKPSEIAPATSRCLADCVREHFPPEEVAVCTGDDSLARALVDEDLDLVFFTGGTSTGHRVFRAAADRLTPVVLELGGKCPCYVHEDADLPVAARRIVQGKFMNAGQVCVAPDYLLVAERRYEEMLDLLARTIERFFGTDPSHSPDFARIVNAHHFDRLVRLLDGGRVYCGGGHDRDARYIAPTVLTDMPEASPLWQEEIFGPLLPVVAVAGPEDAVAMMRRHAPPLVVYVFCGDKAVEELVARGMDSGGVCANECVLHLAVADLPFGGKGASGLGRYHGVWGFRAFSQARARFRRGTWPDPMRRYPPTRASDEGVWRWLLGG